MLRITNIIPIYGDGGSIANYNIAIDNDAVEGNSLNANLILEPTEIDLTSILEVCKQKLQEAVIEN
ncbi:MAG: hypothetical protein LKF43_00155 [Streptococcaceae bacterium]|jgi:hypothetical protein|nr:hypothetical protein [Streptococcaceae bacterium]